MALNHRFPSLPQLDPMVLVQLMSDPKKAMELWTKYQEARAQYEADKAADAASLAEVKRQELELLDKLGSFAKDTQEYAKAKSQFEAEREQWKLAKAVWEKRQAEAEANLGNRAQSVESFKAELEKTYNAKFEKLKYWETELEADDVNFSGRELRLAEREAAVAAREAKAEKLSILLKDI